MKLSIFLIALLTSYNLFSLSIVPKTLKCSKEGTRLIYVNGQENEEEDARAGLSRLRFLIELNNLSYKLDEKSLFFDYSYNRTFGKNASGIALADFMESFVLILRRVNPKVTLKEAWNATYRTFLNLYHPTDPEDLRLISETGVLELTDSEEVFEKLYNATVEDTVNLENKMLENLRAGKKIILLTHSQGNLFINEAYLSLGNKNPVMIGDKNFVDYIDFIGNLQVATPAASFKIKNSKYVTNNLDAILSVPGAKSPNFSMSLPFVDPREDEDDIKRNHGMVNTYLSELIGNVVRGNLPELSSFVFQFLIDVAAKLESNCDTCGAKENRCGGIGEFYINPNGTCGGFIADTAEVSKGMYISPNVDICGYSKIISGTDTRIESSVIHNSNIIVPSFFPVDIIGSTLMGATIG